MKRHGASFLWSGTLEAAVRICRNCSSFGPGSLSALAETERRVSRRSRALLDMTGEARRGKEAIPYRDWSRPTMPQLAKSGLAGHPKSAALLTEFRWDPTAGKPL